MKRGQPATLQPAERDGHAGLIIMLVVVTGLGMAAQLIAPQFGASQSGITLAAQSAKVAEPVRRGWFSLSFRDIAR